MRRDVNGIIIEVVQGDIASQEDLVAVVNAANAQLLSGGGVAGALHSVAGPGLAEECRPLSPIEPGQAIITGGHDLPNEYVIHTLGPVYGSDKPEEKFLTNCYRNSLARAEEKGIDSVAFPAISTGAFGYPLEEATDVALKTILDATERLNSVRFIRFALFSNRELEVHEKQLSFLTDGD